MRPHRLRIAAFGPFAGTVEVDLDALSSGGLFLLHGDTGAGKSTLLDAMGYALYGRVPGVRNDAKRLRSDHAEPQVHTQVQLEATLSGRRVRVTRSPEYDRAKRRGGGVTTQKATVLLEEQVGGAWTTRSTSHREAGEEILDLVGMSAEQFFQVVLLPQGEFARFLRADSTTRAQLLERLFGTGRYRGVEQWLAARRVASSQALEAVRSQIGLMVARVAQAAGVAEPAKLTPGWAPDLAVAAQSASREAQRALAGATTARDAARASAEAARRLAAAQDRRGELLAGQADLASRLEQMTQLRRELERAARAAEVAPVLGQVSARQDALSSAVAARALARAALEPLGLSGDATSLAAAADRGRERIGRLEALGELAAQIDRDTAAAAAAADEAEQAAAARSAVASRLAGLPERRAALVASLAAARQAGVRLPTLQARRDVLAAASDDAELRERALVTLAELREELLYARERSVGLRDKAADVRESRLEAIRFELASMLVPGDPCPVCGSLFHPDPSEARGERVTRDDEDAATAAAEGAQREVEELASRVAAAETECEVLLARLAGRTAGQVAAELQQVVAECDETAALADTAEDCAAAVAELDAEQADGEQQAAALAVTIAEASRRRAEAAGRAESGRERLRAGLDGAADLDSAVADATAAVAAAEAVVEAEAAMARCERELAAARTEAVRRAEGAGFATVEEAAEALREESWAAAARAQLREYDDERAGIAAELDSPQLAVALEPRAEVAGTEAVLRAADAALDAATAAATTASVRAQDLGKLVPQLSSLLAALGPVQEQADRVRRLADLCNGAGANTLRMTLSSFVLAARLEEVAAAASERLLPMTQGRYSLVHTDGAARGGARSGLGLLARDTWTGQDRDTATLSGGETFLASLALALGLTDVVTAEAGGARMEALFIDEGFGTLDDETLDEVMDVLDGLREGGRIVGLVSHVAQLRQRIPAQVHVRKGRSGSDLEVLGC